MRQLYGGYISAYREGQMFIRPVVLLAPSRWSANMAAYDMTVESFPTNEGYSKFRFDLKVVSDKMIEDLLGD